jgi:hypothetical protein
MMPSGHEGMTYRAITLITAENLVDQDFGWDFDNLPAVFPQLKLSVNANCHNGPGLEFASVAVGAAGQSYPIEAISPDYLWYYVNVDGNLRCWMGKGAGSTSGDLSQLSIGPVPQAVCTSITDQKSCAANSACQWVNSVTRASYCTNK